MSKIWVRLKEDPKVYKHNPVGTVIRAYGHDFIIQKDGTLCVQMHVDFIRNEVNADRVEIINPPKDPIVIQEPEAEVSIEDFIKERKVGEKNTPFVPDEEVIDEAIKNADLQQFSFDIGTYYGAGDLSTLLKKIEALKNKNMIITFAGERFKVKLPETMAREEIIDKVKDLVDEARVKFEKDNLQTP